MRNLDPNVLSLETRVRPHRLNWVDIHPFQVRSLQYKPRLTTVFVPVQKTVIEYRPKVKRTLVPVEKTVIDFIPLQKQVHHTLGLQRCKSWKCLDGLAERDKQAERQYQLKVNLENYTPYTQKANENHPKVSKYCRFGELFIDKYLNHDPRSIQDIPSIGKGKTQIRKYPQLGETDQEIVRNLDRFDKSGMLTGLIWNKSDSFLTRNTTTDDLLRMSELSHHP